MEHTPDDPRKYYKPITFYIEDVRKFFQIAELHGGEPKAVFEQLQPPGGKWNITDAAELDSLADKFRHAEEFNLFIAFPKVKEWNSDGVSIRTFLGLHLMGDGGPAYQATYADLDRYLTLLEEKFALTKAAHKGVYFVPSARPAYEPKVGFWKRNRETVEKTAVSEIVKAGVYLVIGVAVGVLGWQKFMASGKNPPVPNQSSTTQP